MCSAIKEVTALASCVLVSTPPFFFFATSPCGAKAIVAATAFNGACMNGEAERTAGAPDLVTPLPASDAVAPAVVRGDIAADDVVAAHELCDGGIWGNTNIGDLGMPEGAVAAMDGDFEPACDQHTTAALDLFLLPGCNCVTYNLKRVNMCSGTTCILRVALSRWHLCWPWCVNVNDCMHAMVCTV